MFNFDTIKKIRMFQNLSGRALAEKCGVSQSNISLIENNRKAGATVQTVERILNGMGYRLIVAPITEENKCPCNLSTGGTTISFKNEIIDNK